MTKAIQIYEWDSDAFFKRISDLEAMGYVAKRETYSITPDVKPDTGEIIHLRSIEMYLPDRETAVA